MTTLEQLAVNAAERRFTLLYDAHYREILGYLVRRLDSLPIAQDLTEDVFVVAWEKLDGIPEEPETVFWLYGVAKRTLANHRRKTARRSSIWEASRPRPQPADDAPADQLLRTQECEEVRFTLRTLRVRDQEVIRLAYWDELPHAAIAEMLGCSRTAVDVRLHRAIRRLGKAMGQLRHIQVEESPRRTPEETPWRPTNS